MATTDLKRPIVRRLGCVDSPRTGRRWFIMVEPEGLVTVWPRRLRPEQLPVERIYIEAVRARRQREEIAKAKAKGKSYVKRRR